MTISWEQRELHKILSIDTDTNSDNKYDKNDVLSVSDEYGIVNQIELQGRSFAADDVSKYKKVKHGQIVYTRSPLSAKPYGIIKIVDKYEGILSPLYIVNSPLSNVNSRFVYYYFDLTSRTNNYLQPLVRMGAKHTMNISNEEWLSGEMMIPSYGEQSKISAILLKLDDSITLHQCEQTLIFGGKMTIKRKMLLVDYYSQWISTYKDGAVRKVTLAKYKLALEWLKKLEPKLKVSNLSRNEYQNLINKYAESHERQTTMDFHHQLKAAILDAVDDGLIERDPTRKVIIKGKKPRTKKTKFLNQYELHTLLKNLKLVDSINYDWLILLIAKTGMRFSEAIALTPKDFDLQHQCISVSKTWDYKDGGGFQPTKNKSSIRKIQIDWMVVSQFAGLIKDLPEDRPIFLLKEKIFNSTLNSVLERHCKRNNLPVISIHGLRHTHASLLLFGGVSIASVAKRLGHASMTTTQKIYIHIIQEMENKDVDLVMRQLSGLC